MSNFSKISITLLLGGILCSCNHRKSSHSDEQKPETPLTLQDDYVSESIYSRSGDLVEELYQELVDKTTSLHTLEENLNALEKEQQMVMESYKKYDNKSKQYYTSAQSKTSQISDSILRQKMESLIYQSNEKYGAKNPELSASIIAINQNNQSIQDLHTILKITLTLPIIEKYQNDHKPGDKELKEFIKKQEIFLQKMDSLTEIK